jgi:hypothetical protein
MTAAASAVAKAAAITRDMIIPAGLEKIVAKLRATPSV